MRARSALPSATARAAATKAAMPDFMSAAPRPKMRPSAISAREGRMRPRAPRRRAAPRRCARQNSRCLPPRAAGREQVVDRIGAVALEAQPGAGEAERDQRRLQHVEHPCRLRGHRRAADEVFEELDGIALAGVGHIPSRLSRVTRPRRQRRRSGSGPYWLGARGSLEEAEHHQQVDGRRCRATKLRTEKHHRRHRQRCTPPISVIEPDAQRLHEQQHRR